MLKHRSRKEFQIKNMNQKGFTIVETLVAITIMMIAIVGPLTVANKALTAALDARNQLIANSLAQETMEYVRNKKDNNIIDPNKGQDLWLDGIDTCTATSPGANACDAQVSINSPGYRIGTCNPTDCSLYIDNSVNKLGYIHDSSNNNIITPFSRYFYISSVNNVMQNSVKIGSETVVTVIVSWNSGTVNNQIRLREYINNAQK